MTTYSIHANLTIPDDRQEAEMVLADLQGILRKYYNSTYCSSGITELEEDVAATPEFIDETYHTDQTLPKVMLILRDALADDTSVIDIINTLQNGGILFRERVPTSS